MAPILNSIRSAELLFMASILKKPERHEASKPISNLEWFDSLKRLHFSFLQKLFLIFRCHKFCKSRFKRENHLKRVIDVSQ